MFHTFSMRSIAAAAAAGGMVLALANAGAQTASRGRGGRPRTAPRIRPAHPTLEPGDAALFNYGWSVNWSNPSILFRSEGISMIENMLFDESPATKFTSFCFSP